MLGTIVLARSFSPEQFAAYGYFLVTIAMLATYAGLGLGVTASRLFAELGSRDGEHLPPIGLLLIISAALSSLSFLLVMALPGYLLDAGLQIPRWMLALGVALTVGGIIPSGGILGLEKYRTASLISLASATVMLSTVFAAAHSQSLVLSMLSIIFSLGVQAAGQLIVVMHAVGRDTLKESCRWDSTIILRITSLAGPMFLVSVLSGSAVWVVGRIILARSGQGEFALYSIGLQWLSLGLLLPGMIARVVLPRLVKSDSKEAKGLVMKASAMAFGFSLLILIVFSALAPWLIQLYGDSYMQADYLIPIFLLVALFSAPTNTIGNAIVAADRPGVWLRMTTVWFVVLCVGMLKTPISSAQWAAVWHLMASAVFLAQAAIFGRRNGLV